MPNIETVTTVDIPAASSVEKLQAPSKIVAAKKVPVENYIKSFVLLIAVYSLIIHRASDDKKDYQQPEQYESKAKDDIKTYIVHTSQKSKQNSLPLFNYSASPFVFHPNYWLLK